jgi:rhamnogalacturonyl hydrolase YesR
MMLMPAARPSRVFAVARATLYSMLMILPCLRSSAQTMPSQQAVIDGMNKVASYWLANDPWKPGVPAVQWTGATLMNGFLEAYNVTGNQTYFNYASNWAAQHRYLLNASDTTTIPDNIACGEVYIKLYKLGGSTNSAIIQHIKANIDYQFGLGSSGYSTFGYVATHNMGMPSFAGISVLEGKPTIAEHMYQMFVHAKTAQNNGLTLWNTTDQLWYRDTTQKSPKTYWSRGNGWAFLALAKMLQTLPTSDAHYSEYLANFRQEAAALLPVQRSDGLWRVDLANATTYPGPEATGTSCFLYGLAYGIRTGILDSATYSPAVANAWNGLMTVCVHPDSGMIGYLQDTGSKPSDRQPLDYNNTNGSGTAGSSTRSGDFGYGLFLLGAAELSKIAGSGTPAVAAPLFTPAGGTYTRAQTVTISSATSGATIRYTTNGTTPSTTFGTVYAGPITVQSTTKLKAIAYKSGLNPSAVSTATYTISWPSGF